MISTVTIERNTTAQVAIEHPDEWDDAQVLAAVKNRAIDIGGAASLWCGDNRTLVKGVDVGADYRDEMEHTDYPPAAVELTDDDLDAPADPEIVDDPVNE